MMTWPCLGSVELPRVQPQVRPSEYLKDTNRKFWDYEPGRVLTDRIFAGGEFCTTEGDHWMMEEDYIEDDDIEAADLIKDMRIAQRAAQD